MKLLIVILFSARVSALSLESIALSRLATARNAQELELRRTEFEELSVASKACRIQLAEHQVPLACYEASARFKNLPERPDDLPTLADLDQRCFRAAFELSVDNGDTRFASPACRERIARARKIRAYRDSDPAPDNWPVD